MLPVPSNTLLTKHATNMFHTPYSNTLQNLKLYSHGKTPFNITNFNIILLKGTSYKIVLLCFLGEVDNRRSKVLIFCIVA